VWAGASVRDGMSLGDGFCSSEAFTRREPAFILNAARGSLFNRSEKTDVNLAHGHFFQSVRKEQKKCRFCLTRNMVFVYCTLCSDGSGAGGAAARVKVWLSGGNPKKGLHLCGLWPIVGVPASAASSGLECCPEKGAFLCNTSPLDRSRECEKSSL
jgi:hypothetical protein